MLHMMAFLPVSSQDFTSYLEAATDLWQLGASITCEGSLFNARAARTQMLQGYKAVNL